ncbi:MAG: hypothetical protein IIY21_01490 [Clostridiales bacterium]|nr:hypothetical protein [Clostridiales bacterium]
MIEQTLKLNLIPGGVLPRVNVSQYDAGSRTIKATLYNGPSLFTIPTGASISVRGTKKDNTGFAYDCTWSGSVVTFTITEQMAVFPGEVVTELVISKSGQILGTSNFIIWVEDAALKSDVDISETEIPAIIELAREQEANAEASAEAAAQSEDNAATSETNAAQSASDASDSATAAAQSASDAVDSASAAAESEDNASDSEQAAKLSEQNAKASEDILQYYVDFVIPRFTIANNRLYIGDAATGEFIVANNRLYIKNAS